MIFQKTLRKIKAYIKLRRDRHFLSKNGCSTWIAYVRKNDPRINRYAEKINDFYHGYTYLAIFKDTNPFSKYNDWWIGYAEMRAWCDKNCKGHWREDFHRVLKNWEDEYVLNDIGGWDILFIAFENEQDYTWFRLRWG